MGHESITMTMRYAHLSPQHAVQAVEKVCQPLPAQLPPPKNSLLSR
jgi:hypothetical protein